MSSIKVDPAFISKYVKDKYKHDSYKKTTELQDAMSIHADGLFPEKLIGERRPSESTLLFDYRKKIFESQTIQSFSKIMNSLAKIRKSQDWSIKHTKDVPGAIKKGESLEDYCEKNFPYFTSVTNWFFKLGLKQYLVDPNAVISVYPLEIPQDKSEYLKPFPIIFSSKQVIDWQDEDYAVLLSLEKNEYTEVNVTYEGDIYFIITTDEIWTSKQINTKGDFKTELFIKHDLGFLPCRKIKAEFCEQDKETSIYKSRLSACLPSWNEAVREYSDMQASVCKHMFPTLVIHTNAKCNACNGVGLRIEGKGTVQCPTCKGKGNAPTSPYEDIEVRQPMASEQALPNPVAYYIAKDTEIIKIQDERIDNHLQKGFAAINFEFLAVGLNQSGTAKELDRSELNAFIYDIAEDIVDILDSVYYFINEFRYSVIIPDQEKRDKQLPTINVPEKYDIISETYLSDEIAKAKTNKINPFIVNALEVEYANKKFNTDPAVRDLVRLSLELDPLAGMTEDEKMVKLNNGGILKQDYVVSSYVVSFVRRAISENKDFIKLLYSEQVAILRKYADEVINQISVKAQVLPNAA